MWYWNKIKIIKKGNRCTDPNGVKSEKTIFLRKLDRHLGQYAKEEINDEIERNDERAKDITVIKRKDFTNVMKIEFRNMKTSMKALENGLLMFGMFVSPDQITCDKFANMLICFKCSRMKSHSTKDCQETAVICYQCSGEAHRWSECNSPIKKDTWIAVEPTAHFLWLDL